MARDDSDIAEKFHGKASLDARGSERSPSDKKAAAAQKSDSVLLTGGTSRGAADASPGAPAQPRTGDIPAAPTSSVSVTSATRRAQRDDKGRQEGSGWGNGEGKDGNKTPQSVKQSGREKSKTDTAQDWGTSSRSATDDKVDRIVCTRYKLGKVLGKGSFGIIHSATDIHTNEMVAVKIESKAVKVRCTMCFAACPARCSFLFRCRATAAASAFAAV